jgi:hypothetical protein
MVVSSISAHSSVVCRAVASDGLNQSDPVASEPTLILNSDPVIISAPADIAVDEGQTFAATIRVDDVDADAVTASCINCPAGSTFLPKSIDVDGVFESAYEFSYAPSFDVVTATQQTVSNTVTIRLEDPYGGVYSHVIPVTVSHVDREPEVILSCPSQKDEGTTMGLFIDITDPDDDSIAVTYLSGIPGTSVAPLSAVGVITQSIPVDVSFDAVGRPRPSSGSEDFVIELLVKSGQYEQIHACSVTIQDIDRPAVLLDPCPPQQWAETETVTWEPRLVDPDYASPITAEFSITNSWSFAGQTGKNPEPTILPTGVHQYEGSHDLIPHTGPRFTQSPIYTYPQTTGFEVWMSFGDFTASSYMTKYEQRAVAFGAKDTFRAYTLLYHNYDIESYTQKNYYRDVTARVTSQSPDEDSLIEKTCSYRITDVDRPPVIDAPPTEITPSLLHSPMYTPRRYNVEYSYVSILFGNSSNHEVNPADFKNSQPWASGITASDPDGDRVSLEQSWFEARNIFLSEWKNGGKWSFPYHNDWENVNTTISGTYEFRDVRHEIVLGIHAYSNGTRFEFEKTFFKEGKIEIEPPDNDPYYIEYEYDSDDYGKSYSTTIKSPLSGEHMYLIKSYDSDYEYPKLGSSTVTSAFNHYRSYCTRVGLGIGPTCWRRYVETLTVPEYPRGPLPICPFVCDLSDWSSGNYYSIWEHWD